MTQTIVHYKEVNFGHDVPIQLVNNGKNDVSAIELEKSRNFLRIAGNLKLKFQD